MNWNDTKQHIYECVLDDLLNGMPNLYHMDEIEQYAAEFADGAEWVIYNYKAEALWHDSAEVADLESEVTEWFAADATINDRIRMCVYKATEDHILTILRGIRVIEGIDNA